MPDLFYKHQYATTLYLPLNIHVGQYLAGLGSDQVTLTQPLVTQLVIGPRASNHRYFKARSHEACCNSFQCASEANRIEYALDTHRLRSHGTTGKQI